MPVNVHTDDLCALVRYALETTRATMRCQFHDEVIIRVRENVEKRASLPNVRDVFLCHAWDDLNSSFRSCTIRRMKLSAKSILASRSGLSTIEEPIAKVAAKLVERVTLYLVSLKTASVLSPLVRSILELQALGHQLIECFGLIEHEPVFDHALVVLLQDRSRLSLGDKLQRSFDGCMIVDNRPPWILFRKEPCLMFCDDLGKLSVLQRRLGNLRIVQPYNVIPMAGEALAFQFALDAKNVDRRGLFPESALRLHGFWLGGGKLESFEIFGCVADNIMALARLPRRSCSEFEHNGRTYIAIAGLQWIVPYENLVVLGLSGCLEFVFVQPLLDDRQCFLLHPDREALSGLRAPLLALTASLGDRIIVGGVHEIRSDRPNVVGEIDIFRKTADRTVSL